MKCENCNRGEMLIYGRNVKCCITGNIHSRNDVCDCKKERIEENNGIDNDNYLKITIHDNDFTVALREVCDILYNIFYEECNYPTEDDFDDLKYLIKHIWYGIHETRKYYRWKDSYIENNIRKDDSFIDYFEPDLEIVNYLDVPEWENNECAYIPLFDGGKIIVV